MASKYFLLPGIVVALLLGAVLYCVAQYWLMWNPFVLWKPKQVALAEELGVTIDDYPSSRVFPYGYFYTRLKPGTPISAVHTIIRGYEASYFCPGNLYAREVYYYFSTSSTMALRVAIFYDDKLQVDEVRGEDEDSRTIDLLGCSPGLLPELP